MKTYLHDAEASLGPAERDKRATLLETFRATHEGEEPFAAEERVHLAKIDAEQFEPADPGEVAAFFARRGKTPLVGLRPRASE